MCVRIDQQRSQGCGKNIIACDMCTHVCVCVCVFVRCSSKQTADIVFGKCSLLHSDFNSCGLTFGWFYSKYQLQSCCEFYNDQKHSALHSVALPYSQHIISQWFRNDKH